MAIAISLLAVFIALFVVMLARRRAGKPASRGSDGFIGIGTGGDGGRAGKGHDNDGQDGGSDGGGDGGGGGD